MRRVIRPAEEEMGNVIPVFLFTFLWFGSILGSMAVSGFHMTLCLFLAAGLLPLYTAVNGIRRALFYRRQRREAVALGDVKYGRICGVIRKDMPYYSGKHNVLRYRRYYHLQVEITDPVTGAVSTVESQGYRRQIHRYLASDQVSVYTDRSGWKYFLEDFRWKEHKSDPGVFDDRPMDFEETTAGSNNIVQILFIVIFILIILSSFLEGGR